MIIAFFSANICGYDLRNKSLFSKAWASTVINPNNELPVTILKSISSYPVIKKEIYDLLDGSKIIYEISKDAREFLIMLILILECLVKNYSLLL